NEAAHLRQNGNESCLAKVSGLATHVRPGQNDDGMRGAVEINVIRNEADAGSPIQLLHLDYRVSSFNDLQHSTFGLELRAAVCAVRGVVREAGQDVYFGECERGLADAPGV